ncbi:metallophosphoesterase [Shewanella schlegeliana]|uniref:Metallophosphoesterase n=1 Tax=Shewanella schlegeliana TaxID=190308 RepID=A0ABS1T089_9GAMM|nr:metallophosphoesterase [Shewanella schlegeliana]MBL4914197.1 metallophosphoesterase [Shewanella schlegeliana]MCL1111409.1 metallophosphoesterase [Shewanella schlegeliana]
MLKTLLYTTALVGLSNPLSANETNDYQFDGPYVTHDQSATLPQRTAYWICNSKLMSSQISEHTLKRPENCGQLPEPSLSEEIKQVMPDSYSGVKKVVALSDVHGQYDILIELLKNQKIIDADNNWAFGDGHMVMTGDMFDRGDQVNEVLWFMYKLDRQAKAAGGMLHLLMGNHEQMVLGGDLRYVHERYELASKLLDRSNDALYGEDTEIGQWLRSKNTLVKINDVLYMHGGISSEWLERQLTIAQANELFRANIGRPKAELKQDELLSFLFYGNGPTWYRGYFKDSFSEAELDKILGYFDVKHITVGHTSQKQVLGLFDNKIIAIDSSIKLGEQGELLLIHDGKLTRGLYDGSRQAL